MPAIRVLIIDDSVVIRKILSEELASDPTIEIAGVASSGALALIKIPQVNPDIVTLDIEMPGMDGLQTLAEIRKQYPHMPVIMFSTLTERGASATLEALSLGASDYSTKPSNSENSASAREHIRRELIPKIKSLGRVRGFQRPQVVRKASGLARTQRPKIDILAIGTSTGGPNALTQMMPLFPADFPVPIVIVQHMPPLFTRFLAERLSTLSSLPVREGQAGQELQAGQAWIAPGGYHMTVARAGVKTVLGLNEDPPENSCRPAVDVLFRSVAGTYGPHVLALVLTGMGADGLRGSRLIREAGGEVFVQDEASSVVWGMPGSVADAGQADEIYPLDQMVSHVIHRVRTGDGRVASSVGTSARS